MVERVSPREVVSAVAMTLPPASLRVIFRLSMAPYWATLAAREIAPAPVVKVKESESVVFSMTPDAETALLGSETREKFEA